MQLVLADGKCFCAAELEKHLKDVEILITTPFHPAYMNKERLLKAEKLKLLMTAGVGSDHVHLQTAADKGMTVVEVTGWDLFTYDHTYVYKCHHVLITELGLQ